MKAEPKAEAFGTNGSEPAASSEIRLKVNAYISIYVYIHIYIYIYTYTYIYIYSGIPRPVRNFLECWSRAILVETMLVGRWGVLL